MCVCVSVRELGGQLQVRDRGGVEEMCFCWAKFSSSDCGGNIIQPWHGEDGEGRGTAGDQEKNVEKVQQTFVTTGILTWGTQL